MYKITVPKRFMIRREIYQIAMPIEGIKFELFCVCHSELKHKLSFLQCEIYKTRVFFIII